MKRFLFWVAILLVTLVGLLWWLMRQAEQGDALFVHCAAGLRVPMSEVVDAYEEEFGVKVHLHFGGSGALASQLQVAGGDLFVPADESYLRTADAQGLLVEEFRLVKQSAGLVVARGNPLGILSLRDLGREGVRVSMAGRSASVGRHAWGVLDEVGLLEQMEGNVVVTKPTVNQVIEDVATGAVDVCVAWDLAAMNFEGVEWVSVPEFESRPQWAGVGILQTSQEVERARHFVDYLREQKEVWR